MIPGMETGPRQAIVAVTYRCNARCGMCDIWRREHEPEVEPSFYYHLPRTLRDINLTGGEPFLRDDLEKVVAVMRERIPDVRIVISSNGLLAERIGRLAPALRRLSPRLGVRISIDGFGATHDRIRGVPGASDKAWASLDALRGAGISDLGIGFTMVGGNEDELLPLFDKALKMGLQFTSTVAHSSPIFFGDHDEQAPDATKAAAVYEELRKRQLRSWRPKNWFRAYFTAGIRDMVRGQGRPIRCRAGRAFFYLDPYGAAYPCHIRDWPLGNLEEGYDRLLAKNEETLRRAATCSANCWMTCTVAPQMRDDFFPIAARVGFDRLKALAGL
jgi:MoaA/NifB/PqqE/SkfB family radical SAM enzyme